MRKLALLSIPIAVLAGVVLIVAQDNNGLSNDAARPQYSIPRRIQYGFTLRNKTNRLLEKQEFFTSAPVKQNATQRCINLDADHSFQLSIDSWGNQMLGFTFDKIPPYASLRITVAADVLMSENPGPGVHANKKLFLKAEKYIEIEAPEVIGLARTLRGPSSLVTAENIHRWVAARVSYSGYSSRARGALYALRHRKGDCTEFMYLFVALCRAAGIPARGIGGYLCEKNTLLKADGYHNWAEFYADGRWWIADPQKKIFRPQGGSYLAMRVMATGADGREPRFSRFETRSRDLAVQMN